MAQADRGDCGGGDRAAVGGAGDGSSGGICWSQTAFATLLTAPGETASAMLTGPGQAFANVAGGFAAGGIAGGNIESAVAGAVSAGLNFGIGELTGHTPAFGTSEHVANVALHGALGCGQQAAAGGSCAGGAAAAGFSSFVGPLPGVAQTGLVGRAVVGAAASRLAGGRAGDGALTAAFEYLFNELGNCYQRGNCSREEHIRQKAAGLLSG